MIAKGGKANAYTLMRFLETQLVIMNPIIPHFSQYCWNKYLYPIFAKSKNYGRDTVDNLTKQAWPVVSAPYDKIAGDRLAFLKDTKSSIRLGLDKAKTGGKKKGKGPVEEPKELNTCLVFVAKEYPEFQKKCLTIMKGFEFDEDNNVVGDHVAAIRDAFDKKAAGLAMKFVAFQLNIAKEEGKEAALRLESSFDEKECIEQNKAFLFENLPQVKEI